MTESLQRDTLVEAVVLCLSDWRGRILAGRNERGWAEPPALLDSVRNDIHAFHFVRDIFDYLSMRGSTLTSALSLNDPAAARTLPARLRFALTASRLVGLGSNVAHVRVLRAAMRRHLTPLIAWGDAKDLGQELAVEVRRGAEVEINWVARDYLGHLMRLASAPGVTHLTLDLARAFPELTAWTIDSVSDDAVERLSGLLHACTLYRVTLTIQTRTYVEALAAVEIAERVGNSEEHRRAPFGVEVLAELPESLELLERLRNIAARRVAQNGAPLDIRLSTRSITSPESVRAIEQGLAVPTFGTAGERDAQWFRLMDTLLRAESVGVVRPVLATEDTVLLAAARALAEKRGVSDSVTIALRRGIAPELQAALIQAGINVRVLAITLGANDYPYALPALLDILHDVLQDDSAFAVADELFKDSWERALAAQDDARHRVTETLSKVAEPPPSSHRLQDRGREWDTAEGAFQYRQPTETVQFDTGGLTAAVMRLHPDTDRVRVQLDDRTHTIPVISDTGFANEPDTDAVQQRNREWFRRIEAEVTVTREYGSEADLDERSPWRTFVHRDRATVLRRGALALAAARDRLTGSVLASHHTPAAEVDHEVSFAIDSARHVASRADGLRTVRGAEFEPVGLALVAIDHATPFGIAAESTLAALAAGSDIVVVTPEHAADPLRVLCEELQGAGLPEGAMRILVPGPRETFDDAVLRLVDSEAFERGQFHVTTALADRIVKRRPGMHRDVRTRGIGTVVFSASSDFTEHIEVIVRSAFVHGGAHPRAARALIVIDALGPSKRVLTALEDAVRALQPGSGMSASVAKLRAIPDDAAFRALTELAPGESWLVEPEQLDAEGTLWSPGVRLGVKPDAAFWTDAVDVPVIGVVQVPTLTEAIKCQHEIGSGDVAALLSVNEEEIAEWVESTKAAALVVNRSTTYARVERHPIGVWGHPRSTVQPMVGSPDRLIGLGNWNLRVGTQSETLHLRGLDPIVKLMIETCQPSLDYSDFDLVRRAALADALAWRTQYGLATDVSGLTIEENILRYLTVPVHVRIAEDARLADAVRVLAAGHLTNAPLTVSFGIDVPEPLRELLNAQLIPFVFESDDDWLIRASRQGGALSGELEARAERIRLVGGDPVRVSEWLSTHPDIGVFGSPVTMAGPVELLCFLRPQAVTIATTRHGYHAPMDSVSRWLHG